MTRGALSRNIIRLGLLVTAVVLSLFARAVVRNVEPDQTAALFTGATIPGDVLNSIQRACQDCHSANTRWPWYAKVPPLSWQIHDDVARARNFMDLGKWRDYSNAEKLGFLSSIDAATNSHLMPPGRYLVMHPSAKLSGDELRALKKWTAAEQQRLRATH